MIIDSDDFYLDLLFYNRNLKRLVAIELKIGKFEAAHKGQMELYLKWLNKYEKQEGENEPIGLILCAESNKEQVELLEMHKDGIMVAEYWTVMPPKEELEAKLHQLLIETKERIERNKWKVDLFCIKLYYVSTIRELARSCKYFITPSISRFLFCYHFGKAFGSFRLRFFLLRAKA
jgi:hypothetical protein